MRKSVLIGSLLATTALALSVASDDVAAQGQQNILVIQDSGEKSGTPQQSRVGSDLEQGLCAGAVLVHDPLVAEQGRWRFPEIILGEGHMRIRDWFWEGRHDQENAG